MVVVVAVVVVMVEVEVLVEVVLVLEVVDVFAGFMETIHHSKFNARHCSNWKVTLIVVLVVVLVEIVLMLDVVDVFSVDELVAIAVVDNSVVVGGMCSIQVVDCTEQKTSC
jgi:hypothetical protein